MTSIGKENRSSQCLSETDRQTDRQTERQREKDVVNWVIFNYACCLVNLRFRVKKASNMAKSGDISFTKVCLLLHIKQDNQSLVEHV